MSNHDKQIKEYLTRTGQTEQELFGGAFDNGLLFIITELVPKALKENKRIVWHNKNEILDGTTYTLEDL